MARGDVGGKFVGVLLDVRRGVDLGRRGRHRNSESHKRIWEDGRIKKNDQARNPGHSSITNAE
jgi:hypothetical protein